MGRLVVGIGLLLAIFAAYMVAFVLFSGTLGVG